MQVYAICASSPRGPSLAEEAKAPHRLFGHVDGAVNYSVALWLEAARGGAREAGGAARLPIFVGGTGLYFKALTQGLSGIPTVPEEVRAAVRARGAGVPAAELHAELARRDPVMAARLRPSDPQRILRALEVLEATGQKPRRVSGRADAPSLDIAAARAIFLAPEREELKRRINVRFDAMLEAGAMAEAEALRAAQSRCRAAAHARAWPAPSDRPSQRRRSPRRGGGTGQTRHPHLCAPAIHLRAASTAGISSGRVRLRPRRWRWTCLTARVAALLAEPRDGLREIAGVKGGEIARTFADADIMDRQMRISPRSRQGCRRARCRRAWS